MTVSTAPTRVLICEDSRTFAAALRRLLERDGDIVVTDVCGSAEEAIDTLPRAEPDLVTMDVELPGMNGLAAVEQIMGSRPVPILVLSSHLEGGSDLTAAALGAGALEALGKSQLDLVHPDSPDGRAFRQRVKLLSRAHVIRHPRSRLRRDANRQLRGDRAAAIGICSSTGGPQTLAAILKRLPETFPLPLLVVQHIAPGFTEGLARWLDTTVPLPVQLAKPGQRMTPGIWIAPEGGHLKIGADGRAILDRTTVEGLHRPSGNVLLRSLAEHAGAAAVAVILSGMGRDGVAGAHAIANAGGLVLAQDEASSAVYGMPKAAAEEAGATVMAPAEIAARLAALRPIATQQAKTRV